MRIVILGAGSAGSQLARRLIEDGKDVALIERDHDIARVAANTLDCLVVQGDGSLPEILERAGIGQAEHFVALTGSDEVNIVTCSVVAAEHPRVKRIARVRNAYFSKLAPARRSFMGVDRFVNPEIETARAFLSLVAQGVDAAVVRFEDPGIILRSTRLEASSPLAGRPLKASRSSMGKDFLAAALERDRVAEVPSGDTVPLAGDVIYLLGGPSDLDALLGPLSAKGRDYRKIVIGGGSSVGRYVAEGFLGGEEGRSVLGPVAGFFKRSRKTDLILVERSMELCKDLARELPEALVLNRDLADEEVFQEEGLEGADLFISATHDQELNILVAARAKSFGVGTVLALADNNSYVSLASRLGVDALLSMRSNVVASIVEYLRGGNLTTLYSFFDRGIKILEFRLPERSPLAGLALRDMSLPKGSLVVFVNRGSQSRLPRGDTRLAAGDRIGIFTSMEAIRAVEELFLGEDA
jgi:trk system potassium uptake protein TrkA